MTYRSMGDGLLTGAGVRGCSQKNGCGVTHKNMSEELLIRVWVRLLIT